MSWASNIPKELSIQPLPLVVLTGLDVKHNAVHKEIWDGFNARTNQKFRYKLLDGDHEYPKCKNKRPIEFYMPKGIFKTNWFNKHLYLVPSLVVVFFDLDWDEPNWKEKQMECATKVELVRHSLLDRSTRIILVLVQKHPSIPSDGENMLARERYPALCTACSIKNNYLFLLHTELMHGYIVKLEEDAFTEPTQTYYTLEIKSVKFKRDSLIKVTHQYLFVRLAIKIAFFNEMKLDVFKAIEYYKQAYLSALDIRFYDSNILELKIVAGMINYKLCKLFFEIKHPIDAIDQFRKHIDIFKIKVGPAELSFEHSAWLSKQFQIMGELFESAIEKGYLSAVQTQHPGFYFHSSANHAIQRRINAKEFLNKQFPLASQWTSENPSPIESLNALEFYGQRPWRQGQGMEILDQQKEALGILCLQELESKENLTPLITSLFKQAITHFQVFNCKRMKQYLSVCMAEEFYYAKDYQESLNIYVKVLNDYNNEHWWPIITSIMLNALKCAYLIADIPNYCLLCTEIIGKNILLSNEEKSLIQKNLLKVLSNEIPDASYHQVDSNVHSIDEAKKRWSEELDKMGPDVSSTSPSKQASTTQSMMDTSLVLAAHKIIPAHVSGMVPFVECKVRFTSRVYNSNQHCELAIYLRVNCVETIQFERLYPRFSLAHYNSHCVVEDRSRLLLEPDRIYSYKFRFLPVRDDIGKELEVSSISLELGKRETRVLVMHWRGDCKNALAHETHSIGSIARLASIGDPKKVWVPNEDGDELDWDEINVAPVTSIVAKKSNVELKLSHKMPIFVDEYYAIKLTIDNKEESAIENLSLTAEFQAASSSSEIDGPLSTVDPKMLHLWIGSLNKSHTAVVHTSTLPNIEPNKQHIETIYVQMKDIRPINLLIRLTYEQTHLNERRGSKAKDGTTEKETQEIVKCTCMQEDKLKLESISAFKYEFTLMSMQMKPIKTVRFGEPFLLMTEIKNEAPYALKFKNTYLNLVKGTRFKIEQNSDSFLRGETLKPNEMATECFCLVVDDDSLNSEVKAAQLGDYLVEWRRKAQLDAEKSDADEDEDEQTSKSLELFNVTSKIALPEVKLESFPFLIEAKLPTFGTLDKELRVTYEIKNKSNTHAIDLECILDENEYFSIAGKKLELLQILPNDSVNYTFAMFPLQVGYCKLPNFHAKVNGFVYKSGTEQKEESPPASGPMMSMTSGETNESLDPVIQNMVPSQIFVFPENIDSLIPNN